MKACGIHFPRKDVKDVSGCILPANHSGGHVCLDKNGLNVEWDFDYSCQCGCWEDVEQEWDCGCIIYKFL